MLLTYWTTVSVLVLGLSDHVFVSAEHFLNEWTAEIPGGVDRARRVAAEHGYTLVRELHSLEDHYILHRSDTPHRSRRSAHHHTKKLVQDHRVTFVQQQHAKERVKREVSSRSEARAIVKTDSANLNDPRLKREWYLNPEKKQSTNRRSEHVTDMRVRETWKLGITGKGVSVCILDDGIERIHPDLAFNYDPFASWDYNDNDNDPMPRYERTNENKHGTRCAGEIAMVANNKNCGVGIAFDSKIGGVRMLDGTVTDRIEAESLCFNHTHVDIYSSSWGPTDDGTRLEGPGPLALKAILKGIEEGRGGKGVIYAWASGNGGRPHDNCNADGYSSSIYTMAISSASQYGVSPWYSEKCASTLATAYSSGTSGEEKVTSTDLHGLCTSDHSGTSAAAPMAAGLLALLLEANPDLTWREVQHIVAHTSKKGPLASEKGWYKNAAGYCVNLAFGFGLMDALSMVEVGNKDTWKPIGKQRVCKVKPTNIDDFPVKLSSGNYIDIDFTTDGCEGQENEVNFLEHVIVQFNLTYTQRGRVSAELESPGGTVVTMMAERNSDRSKDGFVDWPAMSVHTWGERPQGTWRFRIMDKDNGTHSGELEYVDLILFGTKEEPEYRKTSPAMCGEINTATSEKQDESVDDTLHNVQKLLKSNKGSYVQNRLHKMLEAGIKDDDTVKRILEEFGF